MSGHAQKSPLHAAITGASSGIGAALARHYAADGVRLSLLARNETRLAGVTEACRRSGAEVDSQIGDVCDAPGMAGWIAACEARAPLDLLFANAGVGGLESLSEGTCEPADKTARIMAVNMLGVANTVAPLLPRMMARGAGQVVIVSSIAGLMGLPQAPGYSASKAAAGVYGDALRRLAAPSGVRVSVVYPGYVDTPMSEGVPMRHLFLWSAARAARHIAAKVQRGQGQIIFPWPLALLARLARLLPSRLLDVILIRAHEREVHGRA